MSSFIRRKITTDLFVKPTDKHQYLHSASCHPRHCKTSIAYRPSDYDVFALMTLTFCVTHRYSRSTLCPEVIVHGPFIKPSRKSSLCLGYPYFLRSPQPETVPMRRFLLLSRIIPLYPPYVRLPVLTTISSTPQIAFKRAITEEPMIAFRRPPSPRNLLVQAKVPPTNDSSIPPSSTECLGTLLDVLPARNIS